MCSRSSFDVHSSYNALAWVICRLCMHSYFERVQDDIQRNFGIKCPLIIELFSPPATSFLYIIYVCEIMKPMILMFMTTCDYRHHNYGR